MTYNALSYLRREGSGDRLNALSPFVFKERRFWGQAHAHS